MTISKTQHQQTGKNIVFAVYCEKADGNLSNSTWAALGTKVEYDEGTENVVLTSGTAFSGAISILGT